MKETINNVSLKRNTYHVSVKLENGCKLIKQFTVEEVGEILGYQGDKLLCLKNGKYVIYAISGEETNWFYQFINPYPCKVTIKLFGETYYANAEDEESEIQIRTSYGYLRKCPVKSLDDLVAFLLDIAITRSICLEEVEQYKACEKDMSAFLSMQHVFCDERYKLGLSFRLAELILLVDN